MVNDNSIINHEDWAEVGLYQKELRMFTEIGILRSFLPPKSSSDRNKFIDMDMSSDADNCENTSDMVGLECKLSRL